MLNWIGYGYLAELILLIAEISLFMYLLPVYKKHKRFGDWRPMFAGLLLLIKGTLIHLFFNGIIPPHIITPLSLYFHLVGFIIISWGLVRMLSKLFTISHTDFLTKTYTKRYIERALIEALERHEVENEDFSLAFIDLDNFKTVNDEFGHKKGDELLGRVAQVIKENLRAQDCVARYGGDEFMLLLHKSNRQEAEEVMMRCKQAVIEDDSLKVFGIAISGGIATYPKDAKNIQNLAMIADKRMYQDKEKNKLMTRTSV